MATPNLTDEDFRVLQYLADRGDAGITTDRVVQRYRALAKAGLLEHGQSAWTPSGSDCRIKAVKR